METHIGRTFVDFNTCNRNSPSLVRWRNRVSNKFDALLKQTMELALNTKAMSLRELEYVNVDTTVQEKAITFPTDAGFYHKMRDLLVSAALNNARAMSR